MKSSQCRGSFNERKKNVQGVVVVVVGVVEVTGIVIMF